MILFVFCFSGSCLVIENSSIPTTLLKELFTLKTFSANKYKFSVRVMCNHKLVAPVSQLIKSGLSSLVLGVCICNVIPVSKPL